MTQPIDNLVHDGKSYGEDHLREVVTLVTIRDPNAPLLSRIHQELIVPHITDTNDVESLSSIRTYMRTASDLSKQCLSYNVIAALANDGRVVGTTLFGVFTINNRAYVKGEYTIIAPEARKHHTLDLLLRARQTVALCEANTVGIEELAFVVIQVCLENARQNRYRLQRLWRLHGFKHLQFPFVQLPLRDTLEAVTTLELFVQPLSCMFRSRTYLTLEETRAIIDSSCTFRESARPKTDYREYQQMIHYLDQQESVPLCL